jgi:hypothetical protein
MGKITREYLEQQEIESFIESISYGHFNLDERDLEKFFGKDVRELLLKIPQWERSRALDDVLEGGRFEGGYMMRDDDEVLLYPICEIHDCFQGNPEDVYDEELLEDLIIEMNESDDEYPSHTAILYVGEGLLFKVNMDQLKEAVEQILENHKV